MSIAVFTMFVGLFAVPWTFGGLVYPAAAGMRGASRWRVLGYGTGATVALLALASALSGPAPDTPTEPSTLEGLLTVLLLLATFVWPCIALVMLLKSRPAKPKPAAETLKKPWEAERPELLSSTQRADLDIQERAPSEVAIEQRARAIVVSLPEPTPTAEDDRFAHLCPEPVTERCVSFSYRNSEGEVSSRRIAVDRVGTSHFSGFCDSELDERTFRFDRIIGKATLEDTDEQVPPKALRDLLRGYDQQTLRRNRQAATKNSAEILFTGFKKERRAELESIAAAAGMQIRRTVTSNLDFLCAGSNAGPSKLAEARERGALVLNEHQLLVMLESGELPT